MEVKEGGPDNTNFQYSYLDILKNFRVILSLLSAVVILVLTLFYDGIVAPRFVHIGIGKDTIGFLFGGVALLYSLFSPIVGILAKKFPVRYITLSSFFIGAMAIFMLGPSHILHFPENNITLSISGFLILGVTTATVFVPLLAEIIDAIEEKEGIKDCS